MVLKTDTSIIEIAALAVSSLGLVGLLFAYLQFRLSRKANEITAAAARASFVLEIHRWFRQNLDETKFFYRLDYDTCADGFSFEPASFPHSEDEQHLDALLYKLVFVGGLLRRGVLDREDLEWMRFIVLTVLSNEQVQKYLEWLQTSDQIPGHSDFVDAVFLYQVLVAGDLKADTILGDYIKNARSALDG